MNQIEQIAAVAAAHFNNPETEPTNAAMWGVLFLSCEQIGIQRRIVHALERACGNNDDPGILVDVRDYLDGITTALQGLVAK